MHTNVFVYAPLWMRRDSTLVSDWKRSNIFLRSVTSCDRNVIHIAAFQTPWCRSDNFMPAGEKSSPRSLISVISAWSAISGSVCYFWHLQMQDKLWRKSFIEEIWSLLNQPSLATPPPHSIYHLPTLIPYQHSPSSCWHQLGPAKGNYPYHLHIPNPTHIHLCRSIWFHNS